MGIDVFSLVTRFETTGFNRVKSDLVDLDQTGAKTAASLGGIGESLNRTRDSALNGTKGFKDLSAAYANHDKVMAGVTTTQEATTAGLSRLAIAGIAAGTVLAGTFLVYRFGATATDEFRLSQLRLEGVSKITAVPLETLQRVSAALQRDFKLTAVQANDLTAGMNKLTQAAKQPEKLEQSLRALMDLGSARGLTAVQTLSAINSALAGLDEGTDKLFMKNPSEIYKKWAIQAGTTVQAMTQLERAQALLDAVLEDGAKTRGSYEKFLDTMPGKHAQLEAATTRLKIATGMWFEGIRGFVVGAGASFIGWLASAVEGLNKLGKADYSGLRAAMGLGPAMGNSGFGLGTDWEAGGGPSRVGQRGRGQGLAKLWTEEDVKNLAEGFKLGTLTRQEDERRLRVIQTLRMEMGRANLEQRNHLQSLIDSLGPKAEKATERLARLLNMAGFEGDRFATAPDDLGSPFGKQGPMQTRGGFGGIGNLVAPMARGRGAGEVGENDPAYMQGATFMDRMRQGLTDGLRRMTPFKDQLAGFFQNVFATGKIGTSLKNFGKEILAGMGSIFAQMAAKAILAAPLFQAIGAAMHNPFTAGFALLAFGIALSALGASMGGASQGSGGGGDGGIRGRSEEAITRITLTADGAGGFTAPDAADRPVIKVLGVNSPEGQRVLAESHRGAMRRGF